MFEFLFKDFKFRYFERIENLIYFDKNRVQNKNYKKTYILNEMQCSFGKGEEKKKQKTAPNSDLTLLH